MPNYPALPENWHALRDAEKIDWLWAIFYVLMQRCGVRDIRPLQNRKLGNS